MHKHTHPRSRFFPFLRGCVIIFCAYSFMRRFTNALPSNAQISSNPQASSSLCASSNAQSTVAAWCESEEIVTRAFRRLSCSNIHREGYGVVRQPRLMAPVIARAGFVKEAFLLVELGQQVEVTDHLRAGRVGNAPELGKVTFRRRVAVAVKSLRQKAARRLRAVVHGGIGRRIAADGQMA